MSQNAQFTEELGAILYSSKVQVFKFSVSSAITFFWLSDLLV